MTRSSSSNSIHAGIRKERNAAFVKIEKEKFKYFKYLNILKKSKIDSFTSYVGKWKGSYTLIISQVDFKKAVKDSTLWITNAFIEGLILNFAFFAVFGFKINFFTILAYGIILKRSLEIHKELRQHGASAKISKPNQ